MAIYWKSKVLLAKIESSYGVDPTLTGAANGILARNVRLSPMEGQDVSRELEFPYLAAQGMIPTGLMTRIQFDVELVPSGTAGTAPGWGPLLRACRIAQTVNAGTSVVYNPISTSMESVYIKFWIGGTLHVIKGTRGDGSMGFTAQGIPYLRFNMLGLFTTPSEVSAATPTLTGFKKPVIVTNANTPVFTVNSVSLVLRELTFALNNQVEPRLLVGSESVIIPDGAESISARVEAVPVSTFNPYSLAAAQTSVAAALTHGTAAGYITALSWPTCQVKRLTGFENAQNILEWPLDLIPLPSSGNDQWTMTLT